MLAFRRAACSSGRVVICGGPSSVCLTPKRSCSSCANAYVRFHWANAQIWLHDEGLGEGKDRVRSEIGIRVRVRVRVEITVQSSPAQCQHSWPASRSLSLGRPTLVEFDEK